MLTFTDMNAQQNTQYRNVIQTREKYVLFEVIVYKVIELYTYGCVYIIYIRYI